MSAPSTPTAKNASPFASSPSCTRLAAVFHSSVGLPSVDPGNFRFMAAPAALPAPLLAKLIATMRTVLETPDLQTRLKDNDYDPTFLPHPQSRAYIEKEWSKWQTAVKTAGAKVN